MFLELFAFVIFLITLMKFIDDDMKKRKARASGMEYHKDEFEEKQKAADPVFVAPPPPHEDPAMSKPRARLCKLEKSTPSEEFGFNLHAEKGRGHFIGTVDQGGIGDRAGLRMGQRIVGVNGVLVYPNTPHKEVVAQIKRSPLRTTLLVASEDVDRWYKEHGAEYSFDYIEQETPVHGRQQISPHSIQISDDEEFTRLHHITQPQQSTEHMDHQIEIEEVHEAHHRPSLTVETKSEECGVETVTAEMQGDLLEAVFAALPALSSTTASKDEPELLRKASELPQEDLAFVARPPSCTSSTQSSHQSAADVPPPEPQEQPPQPTHFAHGYEPSKRKDLAPVSPPSNGSSLNGYQRSNESASTTANKFDIYGLSAQEARERIRQNKKNIHRGFDMSLEEKYRLVSNM